MSWKTSRPKSEKLYAAIERSAGVALAQVYRGFASRRASQVAEIAQG